MNSHILISNEFEYFESTLFNSYLFYNNNVTTFQVYRLQKDNQESHQSNNSRVGNGKGGGRVGGGGSSGGIRRGSPGDSESSQSTTGIASSIGNTGTVPCSCTISCTVSAAGYVLVHEHQP